MSAARIASVQALALRRAGAPGPSAAGALRAIAGHGLEGDRHADPLSPRQLLLAGSDVYAALALPPHALRENLLLDLDTASLVSGTVLAIGADVRLRLTFQCEACGQLDRIRPGLARAVGPRRGILARVEHGGVIRRGDPVVSLGVVKPAWSDDWRERVQRVIEAVPPGCVVEYRQLARLAGIQSSYCRAFPRLLSRLGPAYADKALPARAAGLHAAWDGAGLFTNA